MGLGALRHRGAVPVNVVPGGTAPVLYAAAAVSSGGSAELSDLLYAVVAAVLAVVLEWLRGKIAERRARRSADDKPGGTD